MSRLARWGTAGAVAVLAWVHAAVPARAWPQPSVDGAQVDRTVEQVLQQPAFTSARQTWLARLRDDIRQWFLERLADLFDSGAGTVLAWALVGAAVVVGVAVGVRAVRGVRRGAVSSDGPAAVAVTRRPPDDWLGDARAAQAAGDLGEAVRCGYRAVVAGLARHEALDEVPGRTVGEYRAQVEQRQPARLDVFTRASEVFERVWYARRPASADDVATVVAVAEQVADGAAGRRAARAGATS